MNIMEMFNLPEGDPSTTRMGPGHIWATVVTTTHTENQGCAKVIVDPGVWTFSGEFDGVTNKTYIS
jgi:hypothetical protein